MKKINWKFWSNFSYWIITLFLILIAGILTVSSLNIPNGIKLFTVQSGSMTPKIPTGSLVIVKPFPNYSKGDIITFKDEKDKLLKNPKQTTTHRIFEINKIAKGYFYVTKGDFNKTPDPKPVDKELVLGKVIASIPYIGFPINYAKTLPGLIILVVIPATLIVYTEIISIKNEAIKLIAERRKRKLSLKEKVEVKIGAEVIEVEKDVKKVLHIKDKS